MRHVLPYSAQSAQDLPGAVNIVHAPTSVPRTIVFLGGDQILNRVLYASISSVEVDVTEKLDRPRRQIAAGRIQNRVVIGEGHIFEPTVNHVLVEGSPPAIATLKAQLPGQSALEQIFVAVFIFRMNQAQRH